MSLQPNKAGQFVMQSIRISGFTVLARGNMTTRETILRACKQNPGKTCKSSDSE